MRLLRLAARLAAASGSAAARLRRTALDVAHGFQQGLVALLGRSLAIDLEQLSEMAHQGRIGQKLRPIRTRAGILGVSS